MAKVFALFLLAILAISMLHTTVSVRTRMTNQKSEMCVGSGFLMTVFVVFVSGSCVARPWRSPL